MRCILVADDEMIERKVLVKKLLAKYGDEYRVLEAENGRQAVELFEANDIAAALLDIEMPGINGLEAAQIIRSKDRSLPIIFVTAFDEFNYAKAAISVHALDYILKPYYEEELFAIIDEALYHSGREEKGEADLPEKNSEKTVPAENREADIAGNVPGAQDLFRNKVLDHMEEHYMEDLSVQDVSETFGYSEAYFCKLFKQNFGSSFVTYLTDLRIGKARELLKEPDCSIKKVGVAVGYPDSNYFAKVFKRQTGKSPSEYRQEFL